MGSSGRTRLSRWVIASEAFTDPASALSVRVAFSTRSGARVCVPDAVWGSLSEGDFAAVPVSVLEELAAASLVVADEVDELAAVLEENRLARERHPVLFQVIQPSAACQLACDYCGQEHAPHTLSEEAVEALLRRLDAKLASGRYHALEISWFGGEPLLGLELMRKTSPRLRDLAARHAVEYRARLVTNGLLLTPDRHEELLALHGIRYLEVTLDGDAVSHDRRRVWKRTGRGSFDAILDNLTGLLERPEPRPAVGIRCNVDRRNVDHVVPLLRLLADRGLHRRLHAFHAAPVHSWGNGAARLGLPAEEFASRQIVWFLEMARLGFPLALLPERRAVTCMTFKPGAEVLDATGARFNCTEVSQVPAYTRGGENLYQLQSDGTLSPAATKLASFHDGIAKGAYPCRECALLPCCGGACAKAWVEGEAPCPPEKYNLPARLVLAHALRTHRVASFEVQETLPTLVP